MYTALPLSMGDGNPRNPAAFIYLMPGVQEGGTFGFINGGQSFSKDVYIEGLPITDAVRQGESRALQFAVSVESVEQFQVETSGQSVEFNGRGRRTTRSSPARTSSTGRRMSISATPCSMPADSLTPTRPQQNQNQYGFTFGGPDQGIASFSSARMTATDTVWRLATAFVTVPTTKMRTGHFSEAAGARSSTRQHDELPEGAICSGQAFPGTSSPRTARISLQVFPKSVACAHALGIANNLFNNTGVGFNNQNVTSKVDHNASEAHRFAVMFWRGAHSQSSAIRGIRCRSRCRTWLRAL